MATSSKLRAVQLVPIVYFSYCMLYVHVQYSTSVHDAGILHRPLCKVEKVEDTFQECPINRKRGRPRVASDSYRRQHKNQ